MQIPLFARAANSSRSQTMWSGLPLQIRKVPSPRLKLSIPRKLGSFCAIFQWLLCRIGSRQPIPSGWHRGGGGRGFNVIGRRCFSGRCGRCFWGRSQSGPGRIRPNNSGARCFSGLVARLGRTLFRSRRRWNRSGILLFQVLLDGYLRLPHCSQPEAF